MTGTETCPKCQRCEHDLAYGLLFGIDARNGLMLCSRCGFCATDRANALEYLADYEACPDTLIDRAWKDLAAGRHVDPQHLARLHGRDHIGDVDALLADVGRLLARGTWPGEGTRPWVDGGVDQTVMMLETAIHAAGFAIIHVDETGWEKWHRDVLADVVTLIAADREVFGSTYNDIGQGIAAALHRAGYALVGVQ